MPNAAALLSKRTIVARVAYVLVCCVIVGTLAVALRPPRTGYDTEWITTSVTEIYDTDKKAADLQERTKKLFDNLSGVDMNDLYEAKIQADVCRVIVCFGLPPEKVRAALDIVIARRVDEQARSFALKNNELANKGATFSFVSLLISVCALFVSGANFLWK